MRNERILHWALLVLCAIWSNEIRGNDYALVVGVKSYEGRGGFSNTAYTRRAAEQFAQILENSNYTVEKLFDEQATAAEIHNKLSTVADRCQSDDRLLIYFAGHGVTARSNPTSQDRSAFCAYDINKGSDGTFQNLIFYEDVISRLSANKCKATYKFIIADACRNGTLNAAFTRPPKPQPTIRLAFSCKEGERANEDERLQSPVFSWYVMRQFALQARDHGSVRFDTLIDNVTARMEKHKLNGGKLDQTPFWKTHEGESTSVRMADSPALGAKGIVDANETTGPFQERSFQGLYADKDFNNTKFESCVFEDCSFINGSFATSNFVNCRFVNCDMKFINFTNVKFLDCSFKDCDFKDSKLSVISSVEGCSGAKFWNSKSPNQPQKANTWLD